LTYFSTDNQFTNHSIIQQLFNKIYGPRFQTSKRDSVQSAKTRGSNDNIGSNGRSKLRPSSFASDSALPQLQKGYEIPNSKNNQPRRTGSGKRSGRNFLYILPMDIICILVFHTSHVVMAMTRITRRWRLSSLAPIFFTHYTSSWFWRNFWLIAI
jgi:hypothetical protein